MNFTGNIQEVYERLAEYKAKKGHIYVSPFPPYKDLFDELAFLRKARKELNPDILQKFEELGFDWKLNSRNASWMYFYEELLMFQKAHGHCNVPYRYDPKPRLGTWVSRQRASKEKLKPWQLKLLNESCFEFSEDLEAQRLAEWEKSFAKLQAYYQKHGNSLVPSTYKKDKSLARWVITQRASEYTLSEYQKQQLATIEFLYRDQMAELRDYQWYLHLEKLKQYKIKYGHCNVPASDEENKELANWVRAQRFLKPKLSMERRKALKALGFKFSEDLKTEREQAWLKSSNEIKSFIDENGTISGLNASLRKWWTKQLAKKSLQPWQRLIISEIKSKADIE